MPKVFISYRREDTSGHAGRLFDAMQDCFGKGRVFMDVAGIRPGDPYADVIDKKIQECDVLLVVIGREWLSCKTESGARRLDQANDFLRLEVASALRHQKRVIPVLVEDAKLPAAGDLPEDIRELVARQDLPLTDRSWPSDVRNLERAIGGGAWRPRPWMIAAGAAALVVVVALIIIPPIKPTVAVPGVTGQAWSEAKVALESVKLAVGKLSAGQAGVFAAGTVLTQSPTAGSAAPVGSGVDLVIAADPGVALAAAVTPTLTGLSSEDAKGRLQDAGFLVGEVTYRAVQGGAENVVLDQDPKPGEARNKGTSVALVLSRLQAQALTVVPDVKGRSPAEAEAAIRNAKLVPSMRRVQVKDPNVPVNTVYLVTPSIGTTVPMESTVEVQIAAPLMISPTRINQIFFQAQNRIAAPRAVTAK